MVAMTSKAIRGDVELLIGDVAAAEATFRRLCEELDRTHAYSHLASRAGDLAEALYRQGAFDEADEWIATGRMHTADDDLDARLLWMPVEAKLAAQRGDVDEALATATRAVTLAETTDGLNRRAAVQLDLAEVLRMAGRADDAARASTTAEQLFSAKGNVVGRARAEADRGEVARV